MNKVLLFGVFVILALCSFSSQAKALDSSVLQEVKVNGEVVDEQCGAHPNGWRVGLFER